jgi:hypothetical protein
MVFLMLLNVSGTSRLMARKTQGVVKKPFGRLAEFRMEPSVAMVAVVTAAGCRRSRKRKNRARTGEIKMEMKKKRK